MSMNLPELDPSADDASIATLTATLAGLTTRQRELAARQDDLDARLAEMQALTDAYIPAAVAVCAERDALAVENAALTARLTDALQEIAGLHQALDTLEATPTLPQVLPVPKWTPGAGR